MLPLGLTAAIVFAVTCAAHASARRMFFSEPRMFICLKTEVRILADSEILVILRSIADEEEARVLIPLRPRAPERGCLWGLCRRPFMPAPPGAVQRCAGPLGRWAKSIDYLSVASAAKRCACVTAVTAARCIAHRGVRRIAEIGRCWPPANAIRTAVAARSVMRHGNSATASVARPHRRLKI